MLRTLAQNIRHACLSSAKRMLVTLAVIIILVITLLLIKPPAKAIAAEGCTREIIYVGWHDYSGRHYEDWVSCGSSAGNFAYSCNETGQCYENTSIDAGEYCHCDME